MKKKDIPAMNVGVALIILIFITLCLVTFCVLSLENAVADRRLSRKAATHTTAYYEASNRIQERLQKMQDNLDAGADRCREGEERIFEEPVENRQKLVVTVTMNGMKSRPAYEITGCRVQISDEWEADRSMDVYRGKDGKKE